MTVEAPRKRAASPFPSPFPSIVAGHSGSPQGMTGTKDGRTYGFNTAALLNLDQTALFSRAKLKQGPVRCWFTRDAVARFPGCGSDIVMAKPFAEGVLRIGAVAWGTDRMTGWADGKALWGYGVDKNGSFTGPTDSGNWWNAPFWVKYEGKK
ncbi:MAG: hypothetical protein WD066_10735 [Planctomycetaceae bacterium]